jgi:hemerythrin-like domain-containing protein
MKINEILKSNYIKLTNIKYYIDLKEAHIMSEDNILFIFDLSENIHNQINKIMIIKTEQKEIIENKPIYIDLRINDKIFYCEK